MQGQLEYFSQKTNKQQLNLAQGNICVIVKPYSFLCPGKAMGGLNLGNFFASHKGYSRQGFDQLSTEGSDQERNNEDSSDSENEEYSALPPPQSSS